MPLPFPILTSPLYVSYKAKTEVPLCTYSDHDNYSAMIILNVHSHFIGTLAQAHVLSNGNPSCSTSFTHSSLSFTIPTQILACVLLHSHFLSIIG